MFSKNRKIAERAERAENAESRKLGKGVVVSGDGVRRCVVGLCSVCPNGLNLGFPIRCSVWSGWYGSKPCVK